MSVQHTFGTVLQFANFLTRNSCSCSLQLSAAHHTSTYLPTYMSPHTYITYICMYVHTYIHFPGNFRLLGGEVFEVAVTSLVGSTIKGETTRWLIDHFAVDAAGCRDFQRVLFRGSVRSQMMGIRCCGLVIDWQLNTLAKYRIVKTYNLCCTIHCR